MNPTERYAWIQLALTPYIGADSFLRLIEHFGTAEAALRAPADAIRQIAIKGKQAAATWYDTTPARQATDAALKWAEQAGCRLMLLGEADYPRMLTEGITPPPLLFVRGDAGLLQRPAVSVVGSRHATPHAMRIAHDFSQHLSERGITVISGMAAGIDTAAHSGALLHSGSTIAIWGTGIDRIYPPENRELAHQIAERGLIVSEFPLGTRPLAGNFPRRNRLIAAQAQVTLVVEATLNSGSLITARLAADMGREVMAIPSSIDNPHAKGCHKLIKEGAKLVECLDDILQECPDLQGKLPTALSTSLSTRCQKTTSPKNPQKKQPEIATVTPALNNFVDNNVDSFVDNIVDKTLLLVLEKVGHSPTHPDFIANELDLSTADVYAALLELEILGKIAALSGGRYQRV